MCAGVYLNGWHTTTLGANNMNLANEFFAGKEMITIGEVAKRLDVSVSAIESWIRAGLPVPYYRLEGLGRVFDVAQVTAWYDKATNNRTQTVKYPPTPATPPMPLGEEWNPNGSQVYGQRKF